MTDTNLRDKLRAVFLATLMIGSVFGAGISFAGSAAADTTDNGDTIQVDGGGDNLSQAISNADDGANIVVNDSSEYDPVTIDVPNVKVEAGDSESPAINASGSKTAVSITANGTTFTDFDVIGDNATKDGVALFGGDLKDVTVSDNVIKGMARASGSANDETTYAVHNWGGSLDGVTVTNNEISDVGNSTYGGASPQAISLGPFHGSETEISGNTVNDLQSEDGAEYGVLLYDDSGNPGNVTVSNNELSDALYDVYSYGGSPANLNDETDTGAKISSLYESNTDVVNVSVDDEDRTDAPGEPNVTDVELLDHDADGDIDAATVTVDENVSDESLEASDFAVDGTTATGLDTLGAYDDEFQLQFDDDSELDGTGPADEYPITYSGDIVDLGGMQLAVNAEEVSYTDSAQPVVIERNLNTTLVNDSDAPAVVEVNLTFSENVSDYDDGDVQLQDLDQSQLTVEGSTDNDTFSGTAMIEDHDEDVVANLTVANALTGENGNNLVEYDQEALTVDTDESLSFQSAETADLDDNGQVDTINVTFDDEVDDSSVLTAVENGNVELDTGTLTGLSDAGTTDDEVVTFDASNVGDTGSTDTFIISASADLYDTAENLRPSSFNSDSVDDDASPIVTDVTLNETTINQSEAPTDIEINATFSEDLGDDPDVSVVGLDQDETLISQDGDDDNELSVVANIENNDEDVQANVNVSGGDDGSDNAVETFNETRLTVDTEAPSVSVNDSELPSDPVDDEIDLGSYFDISGAESDGGETTYLINTTGNASGEFSEVSENFDTNSIDDTDGLLVRAESTDGVGNENNSTIAEDNAINVDNTAPDVTITSPSETTAAPTGGVLSVDVTVDEQNIADDNATLVLTGDNNTIQYNASLADGENLVDLLLNTSANATVDDGERLPNLNATEGSFDTQTVYDLSVTVEDSTNKSTTATQEDALFLDDTAPANFSLVAPSEATEYDPSTEGDDELVVSYGYTENNTESVTVALTNETGTVADLTVDESQYTDDGAIKSFELDLLDSFDTDSLADGQYNVSVTVTDLAGNELVDNTTNAPVAINAEDATDGTPSFEDDTPSAEASINDNPENVTVDVTYNVSVPEVTDAGAIEEPENNLSDVDVTSDDVAVNVSYYDADEGEYKWDNQTVSVDFSDENATANATITESETVDISDVGPTLDDGDRVLTREASLDGDVTITATPSYNESEYEDDTASVDTGTTTFVDNDTVAPELDSIEVVGDVSDTSDELVLTFSRPVQSTDAGISADDFAYINENGNADLHVDEVSVDEGDDTQITITLNDAVEAGDVGSDVVSIQPDVLENTEGSNKNVSATSDTFAENTDPKFDSAQVTDNASVISVTFDEPVQAEDGSDLSAANLSYSGDANVTDVTQADDGESATVTLDGDVTSDELDTEVVSANGVYDRFGNALSGGVGVVDETDPSNLEILEPTEQQIVESGDLLDVTYQYVDNVPDNVDSAQITLKNDDGQAYTYNVTDTSYVTNVSKSLTLDLDSDAEDQLDDGSYDLTITVTDADDNDDIETFEDAVVVNDERPNVEDVTVTSDTGDIAPDSTLNVTYDYGPAPNASSVTVWVVDSDDENASYTAYDVSVDHGDVEDNEVSVDLADEIADNDQYEVFVTATDADGLQSEAAQAESTLDVNAEKPSIDSVKANAGEDTVTVEFTEGVVAHGDDEITRADFVYQDVNDADAGAGSIDEVDHNGDAVTLHLDGDVTTGDLGTDLVNVRSGEIADTDEHDPRLVDSDAVELADTTDPETPSVDASAINANNADSYDVTVDTTSEVTDVSVLLNGPNGTDLSDNASAVTGEQTFTFDASTLEDGLVEIDVELTDASGNNASASPEVEKDTVAPTIEVAAANPGGSTDAGGKTRIVTVAFSEAVDSSTVSADAFTITSDQHSVDDIINTPFVTADNEVVLLLNQSVTPEAIDNGSVAQVETTGVTDEIGNSVTNAVNLTDEPVETGTDAAPSHTPGASSMSAEAGDENVTITFDEVVEAGDGGDLTAANFTYADKNDANASEVDSVTQTGPQTVVVTLDEKLTEGDLAYDEIGVSEDAVFDTSGNAMPASSTPFGLDPGISASAEDGTVTVQVTTLTDIETAVGDGLTVSEVNRELESLEGFELDERFTANVSADDFTEVEPGVYEASVSVPFDDEYTEDGVYSVTGMVDGEMASANTTVDTTAPYPTDAALLDVTSDAQSQDEDTRNTTHIRVLFNEPIEASSIMPSDVSIEGFDGDVVSVQDGGLLGSVEVVVEGKVQTGTSPTVTIDGDSYTDLAGTSGEADGRTVIHTDVLDLEKGQNYVSVPAASGDLPLDEIDTSAVDAIYAYDAESESWNAYDPDAKENGLDALEGGEGYVFVMDEDATIEVNVHNVAGAEAGADPSAPAPTQQSLSEGWNLIGQYQEFDQRVDTALSSLSDGSVYNVLAQDETADGVAFKSHAAGDFQTLERSEGYWVFVQDDEAYTEASGHVAG